MKKKCACRVLTILLSVCMSTSLLTGCGNKNSQAETDVKQMNKSTADFVDEADSIKIEETIKAEEEAKLAEQEDKKAEEESKKVEEEIKKAEEEAKKVEEEARKAEEERIKAEELARKAEEEARKVEEERIRAEEEQKLAEQKNSFALMYYLAITAEDIRTSKNNRLMLDDIYTSLLNDINPGTIDETTQTHLQNLRDIIKAYININTKRERLQFIYNQQKAAAIRSAVPNPLAVLSMTNALDWKKLAMNVVYTAVDSYTNYKDANESADIEFLMSGWELDDEELATVLKNRDRAFEYMVDMVQEYKLDGKLTLNEKTIGKFSTICAIESVPEKIRRLTSEEETYKLLGNYWLELADCYFENSQYDKCLASVDKYKELSTGIFRRDYNYAQIIPKAIVAAQNKYTGNAYETVVSGYADELLINTEKSKEYWSIRYFAAQVYLDLYAKTNKKIYLTKAFDIVYDNVTILLEEQRILNKTYLNDLIEVSVEEPDYRYLTDNEKKEKKTQYNEEKKQAKVYNKALKEARKTELPSVYEPLVLNCELLFALADKMNISGSEKTNIEAILQTSTNGIFLTKTINDIYSFNNKGNKYTATVSKDEIIIPVSLLSAESQIEIIVKEGNTASSYTDAKITKVEREGSDIETFSAYISSKQFEKHSWEKDSKVSIVIKYGDVYDKEYTLNFRVSEYEKHWYGDKVELVQE